MRRTFLFAAYVFFVGALLPAWSDQSAPPALPHEAYVWQRAWTGPVREAVAQHATNFSGLTVLAAEVTWRSGRPDIVRVPIDYASLTASRSPVGLVLRIGPYAGPFGTNGSPISVLSDIGSSLVADAKGHGANPRELQIDFDCAESKLDGYRLWIEAIRGKLGALPIVITTLPAWLRQGTFSNLVAAADGYVLQVHSLERPKGPEAPFSICDPAAARAAVERAGQIGLPFRVALPTYGYLVAFGTDGRLIGLSAEGPAKSWPEGTHIREVRSDPVEIAGLVRGWMTSRPAAMQGIIWYRLPNSLDNLNWPWPTLNAVMAGRLPRESLRVEASRPEAGLTEVSLVNDGEADLSSRLVVGARWHSARLVASDGLRGFEVVDPGPDTLFFRGRTNLNQNPSRLAPGERRVIGWLRLDREVEVQVEIEKR